MIFFGSKMSTEAPEAPTSKDGDLMIEAGTGCLV